MIISALDSGKIFYNYYFSRSANSVFKEEYFLRLLVGLFLGAVSLCFVLYQKNISVYVLIPCLLILVSERTYDEVQRFLISNKNYKKWSIIQIFRSLLYLALTPLVFLGNSNNENLILFIILLTPTALILLYIITFDECYILQTANNLKTNFQKVLSQLQLNWKPCLIGLAGASLALPKNILLIAFGSANINNLHLLFSVCAFQSLYIFSFFLIKKRWKILQDAAGHAIINKKFYINLTLSSLFVFVVGLVLFKINLVSKSVFFYFPLIIASEFLLNVNSTKRDILFYQKKENNLLKIDILILCFFCGFVLLIPKNLTCGLILLIITEVIRNAFYKNKLSK